MGVTAARGCTGGSEGPDIPLKESIAAPARAEKKILFSMYGAKTTRGTQARNMVAVPLLHKHHRTNHCIRDPFTGTLEQEEGRTFEGRPEQKMSAPKFSAMFSLFRQRGPKGFHIGTRYYDPVKEEREERMERLRARKMVDEDPAFDREQLSKRMRHSWQRQTTDRSHLIRLVIVMGLVMTILYYLVMSFGLLEQWNG